jgi:hypothetical protein
MTTKIKEEFKLTKHDVEVCKSFLIFADRQIDFLKEIIEAAFKNQDWSYLGGNAYDVDSLSNMKQLIDRLVNSPIDKGQIRHPFLNGTEEENESAIKDALDEEELKNKKLN